VTLTQFPADFDDQNETPAITNAITKIAGRNFLLSSNLLLNI